MSTTPNTTTRLSAINQMLRAIGSSPVNSIDTNTNVDVAIADSLLDEQTREVQSLGWEFNTEEEVPLTKDGNGEVALPANALRIYFRPQNIPTDTFPIQRGSKLYDKQNRTSVFSASPIKTEIVYLLAWEDLPEVARIYITKRSARMFQEKQLGSDSVSQKDRQDEEQAWLNLKDENSQTGNYSLFDSPDSAAFIDRRVPRRFSL